MKAKRGSYIFSRGGFLPFNMKDKRDFLPSPVSFLRRSNPNSRLQRWLHNYINCLDTPLSLGVYTTAAVALITQKLFLISLHRPLPTVRLILLSPLLFASDFISLLFLCRGMTSITTSVKIVSFLIAISMTLCSTTFVSYYYVAYAEINWGRAVEVLTLIGLANHSWSLSGSSTTNFSRTGTVISSGHSSCSLSLELQWRH